MARYCGHNLILQRFEEVRGPGIEISFSLSLFLSGEGARKFGVEISLFLCVVRVQGY